MGFQCACCSKFNDLEALTTHVQKYGHAHRCSTCYRFFKSQDQLLAHRKEAGHEQPGAKQAPIQHHLCTCGRRFKTLQGLRSHRQDVQHVESALKKPLIVNRSPPPSPDVATCLVCNKRCANADGLEAHKAEMHPCCPTCKQYFRSVDSCSQHQRAAGHCYCREHEKAFRDTASYKTHIGATPHVTGFECIDCDRSFESQVALDDHLASPGHASELLAAENAAEAAQKALEDEETNMRCEQCRRDFKTVKAYQQHKQSLKHKPLSQLICPVSSECKKTFTSPSSLLSHLESGGCKSGMNRLKLNALVHQYDTQRQITSEDNVGEVVTTASAAGALPTTADIASLASFSLAGLSSTPRGNAETPSTFSGVLVEADKESSDTESIDSGVLVPSRRTLSRSSFSILGGGGVDVLSEWSFLKVNSDNPPPPSDNSPPPSDNSIHYNHATKSWPCIIKDCTKSFRKRTWLTQHLYSPFHAPKLFRCPTTSLLGLQQQSAERHERVFKTLSGFAMHLEGGKCVKAGGEEALRKIVGMFESRIREAMGREVKLLM